VTWLSCLKVDVIARRFLPKQSPTWREIASGKEQGRPRNDRVAMEWDCFGGKGKCPPRNDRVDMMTWRLWGDVAFLPKKLMSLRGAFAEAISDMRLLRAKSKGALAMTGWLWNGIASAERASAPSQ
jgi:hypothetical protein